MLTGFGGIAAVSACSAMREGPGISPGAAFAAFASPDLSAAVAASAREESARLDERIKGIFYATRLQLTLAQNGLVWSLHCHKLHALTAASISTITAKLGRVLTSGCMHCATKGMSSIANGSASSTGVAK